MLVVGCWAWTVNEDDDDYVGFNTHTMDSNLLILLLFSFCT